VSFKRVFIKWRTILVFFLAGVLVLTGGSVWQRKREIAVPAYNSHNLIRLHVIANSDAASDQDLKRRVRDAVLARTGEQLAGAGNVAAARQLVSQNLQEITAVAKLEIMRQGKLYAVRTEIGDFDFPTRAYGSIVLPAGNYEAVRLVIGEGKGQNWWCVLFPPLCLVDVAGKLNEEAIDGSYPVITHRKELQSIQVRWKIVELFRSSRRRLAGL